MKDVIKFIYFSALAFAASLSYANDNEPTRLTWVSGSSEVKQYTLNDGATFGQLLDELVKDPMSINWELTRLSSDMLTNKVETERQALKRELNDLIKHRKTNGDFSTVSAIARLRDSLADVTLSGSYYLGVPFYSLRALRGANPQLDEFENNAKLTLTTFSSQMKANVRVLGAIEEVRDVEPHQRVIDVLNRLEFLEGAETDYIWLIRANGMLIRLPIRAYNATSAATCFNHNTKAPLINEPMSTGEECWPDNYVHEGDQILIGLDGAEHLNLRVSHVLKHRVSLQ